MVDVKCSWDNCDNHTNRSPSKLKKTKLTFCCNKHKEMYRKKYRYYKKNRQHDLIRKLVRFAYLNGKYKPNSRWLR
jgi:hypothetical protein